MNSALMFRTLALGALVVGLATDVAAQRCAGVPTYSPQRLTFGAAMLGVPNGGGEDVFVRLVERNLSFDARLEYFTSHVRDFPFTPTGLLGVRTSTLTVRRAIASGDGHGALCVIGEMSRREIAFDAGPYDYRWSGSAFAVGLGYAVPARFTERMRAAAQMEYRLHWHHVDPGDTWGGVHRAFTHEVAINVGADLPGPLDLSSQLLVPFFGAGHERATHWRPPRMPTVRLGGVVHLDWSSAR